jgi:hypothetical protein
LTVQVFKNKNEAVSQAKPQNQSQGVSLTTRAKEAIARIKEDFLSSSHQPPDAHLIRAS